MTTEAPGLSPQQPGKLGVAAVAGRVGKLSSEVAVVKVCPTVGGIWESFTIPTGSA